MEFLRSPRTTAIEFAKVEANLVSAEAHDTILLWDGANAGEFLKAKAGIVCSTSALVLPRGLDRDYLYYVCKVLEPTLRAVTVGMGIPHVDGTFLKGLRVPVPPIAEQASIARFLNGALIATRTIILAKMKLVKLLRERRQAVIQMAVTRGLDEGNRRRRSGVEWLPDLPAHWEVISLKRLARSERKGFADGDWIELPYITDKGVRLIQTGNVGLGTYREKGYRYVSEATFTKLRCTEVSPGDVLICRLDGPVGRACVAPDLGGRAITSVDNVILKLKPDVDARYLVYLLSSQAWLGWVESLCRAGGGFRYRISRSALGALRLPMPPHAEQREIANHLDGSIAAIDKAVQMALAVVTSLEQYRQRLIVDVVTGKRDVRHADARFGTEAEFATVNELDLAGDSESGDEPEVSLESTSA